MALVELHHDENNVCHAPACHPISSLLCLLASSSNATAAPTSGRSCRAREGPRLADEGQNAPPQTSNWTSHLPFARDNQGAVVAL